MITAIVALLALILGTLLAILVALGVIGYKLTDLQVEAHAMNEPLVSTTYGIRVPSDVALQHRDHVHVNPVNVGQYL